MDFDQQSTLTKQLERLHTQLADAQGAKTSRRGDRAFHVVRRAHIKALKVQIKRLIRALDRLEQAA